MLYIVRALVFLLQTAVNASGVTMSLAAQAQPPEGGTLLGSAPSLALPVRTLRLTRGSGPSQQTFWTGYWTLAT